MSSSNPFYFSDSRIIFSNFLQELNGEEVVKSIIEGLIAAPKRISSIFLYDATGSKLFQQITTLPEYYLSKIESSLIKDFSKSHYDLLDNIDIIELGSGDCSKISIILDAVDFKHLHSIRYIPVDISPDTLKESAQTIIANYSGIKVHCIAANFLDQNFCIPQEKKRIFCFFGSTIGNFPSHQRIEILKKICSLMHPGDVFLLGVDMVKNKEYLEKAYNDSANITALFNRNILNVINSITGSNFNPLLFDHFATYNEDLHCIEMYLRAQKAMAVSIPGLKSDIFIEELETIHTEYSYKFTVESITRDIRAAGLKTDMLRTDKMKWFSLLQISKEAT
ncbi:MAG TPA: L-histidine N(alpha)-methyltransferase [Chitinispirillaceae bacterium]|nr:L-histidine N(alpha)-methyltransferase [Chitinispirillaceae bacterium]